jgi:cobalt-zinc-cadmium efflux system membrane fusion protein
LARTEAARETTLLEKGVSSDRDYQAVQTALAAAEADFAALREESAFDSTRRLLAAQHAGEVARSAFEAGERELHILGLAEDQVANVGSEAHAVLTWNELRSPAGGRIVDHQIVSGEWVDATDVLLVVADTSNMWLLGDAYERDLLRLRRGLEVLFTVDGLAGVSFEGTLSWVSSQVDDRTRTVRVRADLPNPDGLLRARMFGHARIVLHDDDEVVSVPSEAIQTDGCCQLVFVQQSDAVYQPRKVLLGSSAGGFVEVLSGLDEGESVVTVGSFLMKTEILKSNIGAGCCEVDPGR